MVASIEHLHAWAIGRPIVAAITAQRAAAFSPQTFELLELLRTGAVARVAKQLPPMKAWLALYDDLKIVERVVTDFLFPVGRMDGPVPISGWFYQRIRGHSPEQVAAAKAHLLAVPPKMRAYMAAQFESMFRAMYQENRKDIATELAEKERDKDWDFDQAMQIPHFLFMVLVVLPCVMEWGELPNGLYKLAREGDLIALEKLLLIDKSILWEPTICERARQWGMEYRTDSTAIIVEAFQKAANRIKSRKKLNVLLAAMVIKSCAEIGYQLGPSDMQSLFDAAAKDRTGDENAIETEWPDDPDAARQAIHRGKDFWTFIDGRDKRDPDICHRDWGFEAVVLAADETAERPSWIGG